MKPTRDSPLILRDREPESDRERTGLDANSVEAQCYRFTRVATVNLRRGWGPVPLDGKRPREANWHGWDALDADRDDIRAMAHRAAQRIAVGGGRLDIGARCPVGVIGIDVDDYAGKRGGATVAAYERLYGPLPGTYRVTARGTATASGIRLYAVPFDWVGRGALRAEGGGDGHVELIQRHLRYLVSRVIN